MKNDFIFQSSTCQASNFPLNSIFYIPNSWEEWKVTLQRCIWAGMEELSQPFLQTIYVNHSPKHNVQSPSVPSQFYTSHKILFLLIVIKLRTIIWASPAGCLGSKYSGINLKPNPSVSLHCTCCSWETGGPCCSEFSQVLPSIFHESLHTQVTV